MSGAHYGYVVAGREANWTRHIRRVAAGEQQGLADLYDESSPLVYSLALRIAGNPADAEEVALDVYTHVWQHAANFDPARGTALAWLAMLTRSRALDRVRSRSARHEHEVPITELEHAVEPDAIAGYEAGVLRRALGMLPEEQRVVIELAFYSGFSQSELAAKLGLPLGTVKTRTRLGMSRLRDLLKEFHP